MTLKTTYIQYGVPSEWADNYASIGISATTFKHTSKKNLIAKYNIAEKEIDFVKNCLTRQPIDESVLLKLLENSRFVCCLCKGHKGKSYIVHHINEYSISKDNSYNNLAVLCPNDHDLAHPPNGVTLTNRITPSQIRTAKKNWEKLVKEENKITAKKTQKIHDWSNLNPYKELYAYQESDSELFFGRKEEIEELSRKIYKYGIVGLFGESGTGKTSLINAGIIPTLKKDSLLTISVRCLDEPIKRIREALIKSFQGSDSFQSFVDGIASSDTFPHLIIQLISIVEKMKANLIIVIDQFEELFTRSAEEQRKNLALGLNEALTARSSKWNIFFLLSLREDYIGDLWDWSHNYKLEEAWIHQFRIKRLTKEKAQQVITEPLVKLGIRANDDFINYILFELMKLGNGLIYPPYLQIVCSTLFEEYKRRNPQKPNSEFGKVLLDEIGRPETIIANYLSESMLYGLTEDEKSCTLSILDVLTGPEGLRNFLNTDEIAKHLSLPEDEIKHVIEHLIKKKIVHPVIESDVVISYELVHDFLSRNFFEKLSPEAKKTKTTKELFRQAFKEWEQHGVLASKDKLEILFNNIKQIPLNHEEWTFLIKSSFSVYWAYTNEWVKIIDRKELVIICNKLLMDKNSRIVNESIDALGTLKDNSITPTFLKLIKSPKLSSEIKETVIRQFGFKIVDERILPILENIIKTETNYKLRKTAVYSYASTLRNIAKKDKEVIDRYNEVLFIALKDSKVQVRKEAADAFVFSLATQKTVIPLIDRLKIEQGVHVRKAIIGALGTLIDKGISRVVILPLLKKISNSSKEDYRVKQHAKDMLKWHNSLSQ